MQCKIRQRCLHFIMAPVLISVLPFADKQFLSIFLLLLIAAVTSMGLLLVCLL